MYGNYYIKKGVGRNLSTCNLSKNDPGAYASTVEPR